MLNIKLNAKINAKTNLFPDLIFTFNPHFQKNYFEEMYSQFWFFNESN